MMWPLSYAMPGETVPATPDGAEEKEKEYQGCTVSTISERVVAVRVFTDASVEPVVRKADRDLREACARDGLAVQKETEAEVRFSQYNAIFSMGERRSEVWIDLDDSHPWST